VDLQRTILHEAINLAHNWMRSNNFGFIAVAISPWHALGVDAWLRTLRDGGEKRKGLILILPHAKDGLLLQPEHFQYSSLDEETTIYSVPEGLKLHENPIRNAFIKLRQFIGLCIGTCLPQREISPTKRIAVCSPYEPNLSILAAICSNPIAYHQPHLVIVDEGIGTYMPSNQLAQVRKLDTAAAFKQGGANGIIRLARYIKSRAKSRIVSVISSFVIRKASVEERFVFNKDASGHLARNRAVINSYKHILELPSGLLGGLERSDCKPLAILVTQPLSEYNDVRECDEMRTTSEALAFLLSKDFNVLLKPHPREPSTKYDSLISNFDISRVKLIGKTRTIEALYPRLQRDDIVVGQCSTALITAAAFYDLRAYSYGYALLKCDAASQRLITSYMGFRGLAGEMVRDLEEL
jgi:hypothetical protein